MNWPGVVTMIGVVGVIWGGFLTTLVLAVRQERRRSGSVDQDGRNAAVRPDRDSPEVR